MVWLRADKPGPTSGLWPDQSGNRNDASSAATEAPVATGSLNFNKAFTFDGLNDYMKVPHSLEGSSAFTVLSVFQTADTTERGVWGTESATSRDVFLSTRNATGPDSVEQRYGKNEAIAILNTSMQLWDETVRPVSPTAFIALGSTGKNRNRKPLRGVLAEFMVFDGPLNFIDLIKVETYLAIKYGIAQTRGNYVSSDEKILWHKSKNKKYNNRVAGIGRDDAFQLHQKQTRSEQDPYGLITLIAGRRAADNESNKASINNLDFLIFGDNGAALSERPGQGQDSLLSYISRQWQMQVSGKTGHQLATELRVEMSKLPAAADGYWLVIDRSGSENFSIDNLEYILPDSVTKDSVMVFKNVLWDTDKSGNDHFGFVKAKKLLAVFPQTMNPTCLNRNGGSMQIHAVGGTAPYEYLVTKKNGGKYEYKGKDIYKLDKLNLGEYTVKVTDASRNISERKLVLSMPDTLIVDAGPDLRLTPGKEITLDASKHIPAGTEVSYNWTGNFGFTGEKPSVSIVDAGIYTVSVTRKSDGCVFSDEVKISGSEEQRFAVFPNIIAESTPYNISVSLPQQGKIAVKVYDLRGNLLQTMEGENDTEYHFITQVKSPGMYVIVLQSSRGIATQRLVAH